MVVEVALVLVLRLVGGFPPSESYLSNVTNLTHDMVSGWRSAGGSAAPTRRSTTTTAGHQAGYGSWAGAFQ